MTTVKEHGMLYKAEMVNAILREIDPKEQTRRPVTFANSTTDGQVKRKEWHLLDWDNAELHVMATLVYSDGLSKQVEWPEWHVPFKGGIVEVRPRIWLGHRIWVRETFKYSLRDDGSLKGYHTGIDYIADWAFKAIEFDESKINNYDAFHNRPSLLMPRWASRIDLNVTGMRSQRIQEISEHDAIAEGATKTHLPDLGQTWATYKQGFEYLWDSINTERGFPWVGNHPVWIHDFKRIDKEGVK